jgi:hypothetical protein
MHLKNQLVTHRKIHFLKLTRNEENRSEFHVVDLCFTEIAVVEITINKCEVVEIASTKIAVDKGAGFKFVVI